MKKARKLTALVLACAMALGMSSMAFAEEAAADEPVAADYITGDYTKLPEDGEAVALSMAYAGAENSDAHTVGLAFKEALETYSDGKITVTIYPNGQMGSDAEMITACLAGDIDIIVQSGSTHLAAVPEAALFDTPFLTAGVPNDVLEAVMIDSEFRDMYDACNEAGGLKLLWVKSADTMNLTSNRAVYSMEDLKGLKIRTAQSESRMAVWAACGANPTPLAFSERYMALQNGTVDAQDNAWLNAVVSGAAEQQKYMIPTQHMRPSMDATMSLKKFESLPEEYQALILEVSDDICHFDYALSNAHEMGFYNQLQEEYGLEVCEVSEEFNAAMVEACQEPIQQVHASVGNEDLYAALANSIEAAQQ